jgi:hypothetical protein
MEKTYTFTVTQQEAQLLIAGVGCLSINEGIGIFTKLKAQAAEQDKPKEEEVKK